MKKKKKAIQKHVEIEVRFLDIDYADLKKKLKKLGAKDLGEDFLREMIFYDQEKTWLDMQRFVRIRTNKSGSVLSYKHQQSFTAGGTREIEFPVSDIPAMEAFLLELGVERFRIQEKRRHTFILDGVTIDIDTWPSIPTYVEFEGDSEKSLKMVAKKLGFAWQDAVFENAKIVIEERYRVPVSTYKHFTFEKIG